MADSVDPDQITPEQSRSSNNNNNNFYILGG